MFGAWATHTSLHLINMSNHASFHVSLTTPKCSDFIRYFMWREFCFCFFQALFTKWFDIVSQSEAERWGRVWGMIIIFHLCRTPTNLATNLVYMSPSVVIWLGVLYLHLFTGMSQDQSCSYYWSSWYSSKSMIFHKRYIFGKLPRPPRRVSNPVPPAKNQKSTSWSTFI